jgi:transposase
MRDDGYMRPTFAQGKKAAVAKLLKLRQQAQRDKEPRMILRIRGILMSLMSLDGHSTGEIADHLKVHRSTVPLWIDQWNRYGKEGLLEGHRSGRPTALSREDRERLCDILDSGPVAYGLETGIWTSPLVRHVIEEEFGLQYHTGHVRKLLRQLGYSVQRPTTRLVQADVEQHRKWVRYTYPNLKKTPNAKGQ